MYCMLPCSHFKFYPTHIISEGGVSNTKNTPLVTAMNVSWWHCIDDHVDDHTTQFCKKNNYLRITIRKYTCI